MKSLTNKLMVAAAAIAAVASVASAQSMKVEVPFSFEVSGTVMPAGSYRVTPLNGGTNIPAIRMLNMDVSRPVLVLPSGQHDGGPTSWSEAKLVFSCASGACSLAQIWTGSSRGAYDLHVAKQHRQEAALISIAGTRTE